MDFETTLSLEPTESISELRSAPRHSVMAMQRRLNRSWSGKTSEDCCGRTLDKVELLRFAWGRTKKKHTSRDYYGPRCRQPLVG